ncbi:MAG: metallophosphoesterase [Eubacteriales bacterium]|nr:metallophosphoesterase [Eubacteriales bacterium]
MKVFSISDLHLSLNNPKPMNIFGPAWDNYVETIFSDWKEKVGQEDVVLIAGDISWAMKLEDAKVDLDLIGTLPGNKIIIRGNHDYWWKSISLVRSLLPEKFYALQNDCIQIGDYIFCGTRGWQVPERNFASQEDEKIFKRELIRLELSLSSAKSLQDKLKNEGKETKIICMVHFPPFNSRHEENEFTKLFDKFQIEKVIYGHLHGTRSRTFGKFKLNNTSYYLTSCDLVENKLVEIE